MHADFRKPRAEVDTGILARRLSIRIAITAVTVRNTSISRNNIPDCEVCCQCYAPGDHHSISITLFASILLLDPDSVRHKLGTGHSFVHISWNFGRGAPARFETRLILTDDVAPAIKFTHGLEEELRLDQYMRNIAKAQIARPQTDVGKSDNSQSLDIPPPSPGRREDREDTIQSGCPPPTFLDRRMGKNLIAHRQYGNSSVRDTIHTALPHILVKEPQSSDTVARESRQAGDMSEGYCLTRSRMYGYECHGAGHESPQAGYGCPHSGNGLYSLDCSCHQPRSVSFRAENGSYYTECGSGGSSSESDQLDEEPVEAQLRRQLADEIQYRRRRNNNIPQKTWPRGNCGVVSH